METYRNPNESTKRILVYKFDHPEQSARQIASALNITYASAYNALYQYDALGGMETLGHVPDIVGKNKPAEEAPTEGQKVLRNVLSRPDPQLKRCQEENTRLRLKIETLEAVIQATSIQRRGLENVITYLESKLGIDEIDARLESTKD
jgi:hypothetical protein